MTFTHKTAIAFFVQKILEQAQKDNITISKAQEYIFSLNTYEPDSYSNRVLIETFENESSIKNFEIKTIKLISNAYQRDVANNSDLRAVYGEACKALKSGNYYIYRLVTRAIGHQIDKIGEFFGRYTSNDEYILWAILSGFIFALLVIFVVVSFRTGKDILAILSNRDFLLSIILSLLATVVSVRKYLRLTKKGLYDIYFRQRIDLKSGFSFKGILSIIGIFFLITILTVTAVSNFIAGMQDKDYFRMTFGSIEIIFYTIIVIIMMGLLFIKIKLYLQSNKRRF